MGLLFLFKCIFVRLCPVLSTFLYTFEIICFIPQLERQIQMQNQMRERQMAMMVARSRDMFQWFGAFYGTYAFVAIAA